MATAVTLARLLSEIPLSRGGPTSVVIFDIHALQVGPGRPRLRCRRPACAAPACPGRAMCGRPAGPAPTQERFYFGDTVLPLFESGIPLLRERMASLADVTVAYPDEGAWKRFHSQFGDYPEVRHQPPASPSCRGGCSPTSGRGFHLGTALQDSTVHQSLPRPWESTLYTARNVRMTSNALTGAWPRHPG